MDILVLADDPWLKILVDPIRSLGHRAHFFLLDTPNLTELRLAQLDALLTAVQPKFGIIQNFYGLDLHPRFGHSVEEILEKHGVPLAVWFVDSPESTGSINLHSRWNSKRYPKDYLYFCVDREHLNFFTSKGLPAVHLPIGVDSQLRHFKPDSDMKPKFSCPISFVGRPAFRTEFIPQDEGQIRSLYQYQLMLQLDHINKNGYLHKSENDSKAILDKLKDPLGDLFGEWFSEADSYWVKRRTLFDKAKALLAADEFEMLQCCSGRFEFSYSYYQLTVFLRRLLPFGLRIFGGEDWANFFNTSTEPTRHLDQNEMYHLFSASKVNFCYTKMQFLGAVHERPLLALACGGFPLTDDKAEIHDFFRNDEIVTYRGIDEALDLARHYIDRDHERESFIAKGRERVFSDHTYENRMRSLIEMANQHWNL